MRLSINFAPVADAQNHDCHRLILNLHDEPIIADPIASESRQRPAERVAKTSWVLADGNAIIQKAKYPAAILNRKLLQLSCGRGNKYHPPPAIWASSVRPRLKLLHQTLKGHPFLTRIESLLREESVFQVVEICQNCLLGV